MQRHYMLEYWSADGGFVGRVKEMPGVIGRGETLEALEEAVIRACQQVVELESHALRTEVKTRPIAFEVYYAPGPE